MALLLSNFAILGVDDIGFLKFWDFALYCMSRMAEMGAKYFYMNQMSLNNLFCTTGMV